MDQVNIVVINLCVVICVLVAGKRNFCLYVCIYIYVFTHVWTNTCMCAHICGDLRMKSCVFLNGFLPYSLRQYFSIKPELVWLI